jgi:hypothetical protein
MLKWAKTRRKRKSPKSDDFSSISSLIAQNLTLRAAPPRKIPRKISLFANFSTSENELQTKDQITPLSYFQEDESTRAWGDELMGDLLYTIILRRVRYSKNSDEGLQWETQKVKYYEVVLEAKNSDIQYLAILLPEDHKDSFIPKNCTFK